MLNIPTHEIKTCKRAVSVVQGKERVRRVSALFMPGRRKTLEEAPDAVSSVLDSSADFSDPVFDVCIVDDKVDQKTSQWDL